MMQDDKARIIQSVTSRHLVAATGDYGEVDAYYSEVSSKC